MGTAKLREIGRQRNQAAAGQVSEQFQAESRRTQQEKVHVLAWKAKRWPWACAAMVEFFRSGQSTELIPGGGTCSELSHPGRKGPWMVRARPGFWVMVRNL